MSIYIYNQLDLQTLGSQPVMFKNLPDHWLMLRSTYRPLSMCLSSLVCVPTPAANGRPIGKFY